MKDCARAAAKFGVKTVTGFTGSSIWHSIYAFPPTSQAYWDKGFADFATRWTPIDLDLLLFDDAVIGTQKLRVPHPRMHLRAFVIAPLAEIAPDCRIPGRGSVAAWLPAVKMQRIERMMERKHTSDEAVAGAAAPVQ